MRESVNRSERILRRERESGAIEPVLKSMQWSKIRAGLARVKSIDTFISRYQMYVPLLFPYQEVLVRAKESGRYKSFELYASADLIAVGGVKADNSKEAILFLRENYWIEDMTEGLKMFTPW